MRARLVYIPLYYVTPDLKKWCSNWCSKKCPIYRKLTIRSYKVYKITECSSHDFQKTPDKNELVSRMVKMQQVGADLPKVAVMPHDSTDVLILLAATIEMKTKYFATPIITISMGKLGVASRLCGEVFGSAMTFASAGDSSAPGQISFDVMNLVLDSIIE